MTARYQSLEAFVAAMNERPRVTRGRPPPHPGPVHCTGCRLPPRFRDNVPVNCVCTAPPHPLAYLNLLPADFVFTSNHLRRLQEMRYAALAV